MQIVRGVCAICGNVGVLHTCPLCGRMVCDRCLTQRGACVECSRGRIIK
ncbi:orotate phosphoribosyltransferase [Methanosarcinales archaeon ex4572_44]|nr:MAG: orotate phosphoribosyltransferase [Methanosarcinales archaeon ex4484_138]PHP45853.1 MAG: orotate phosphoribosyltransferase [Methanosarcinales archaeon ex4572_44]RLG25536.1 MAG: orotate phosphoribosyltransferase [Methanosarcinales archaeon]RLG26792.1 MAG: orotate phosphoribosyltransferase [Methanosarcinales archaeon]HHI30476.1 orotate phosphoribosyltransferase [Candidatus Methanoperedenaceae archaeon]